VPIESCPSELKAQISKFIGQMAHTYLGSSVYPRLVLIADVISLEQLYCMSVSGVRLSLKNGPN
jgi:hypothetical protein